MNIIYDSLIDFIKFLPILLLAIIISQLVVFYIPKDKLTKKLKPTDKNLVKASLIGIATPGPLLAYLPFINSLKQKGIKSSILATFITGQTLVGPGRLIIEIKYLGLIFFVYRVILSIFIAIAVGLCFKMVEKRIKI